MNTRLIIGAFIVLIGISILFDLNLFRFIIPFILIWIGVQIITGKDGNSEYSQTEVQEDRLKRVLIFSSMNQLVESDTFQGGEIITIFGKAEADLTTVKTKEKHIAIDLTAVFGSIDLRVPENWNIHSEGVGVLGSFNNNSNGGQVKKTVDVKIKGVAILGEVKVSN